jgi:hypothetical protein
MNPTDPPDPPPTSFVITEPGSLDDPETEVDEEQVLSAETVPEGVEYLGTAPDLPTFFRRELEDLVDPSVTWILDCLDMRKVQDQMEGQRYRYLVEAGAVYRVSADPSRPWTPRTGV